MCALSQARIPASTFRKVLRWAALCSRPHHALGLRTHLHRFPKTPAYGEVGRFSNRDNMTSFQNRFTLCARAALFLLGATSAPTAIAGEPVVITAARVAQSADETLAPVTVITRADIERSQAPSVEALLRDQTGITVANQGGAGKQSSVFLRGTNSSHVLVLIDGVKIGSATAGLTAFQDLPLEQIERIEIVRGPRSSLYGSEAIGGVIQIFTRTSGGPQLSLGGGAYGTTQAAARHAGTLGEQGWYSLGLAQFDTRGFNACRGTAGAGCFTASEPDRDGYRNLSGHARLGWRDGNRLEAQVNWLRAEGDVRYDGGFQNQSNTVQDVLGASLALQLNEIWRSTVKIGRSLDVSHDFKDGSARGHFETRRDTASWQNDLTVGAQQLLTLGLDWQHDHVNSSTNYDLKQRRNLAAFAQYLLDVGAHSAQLAVRRDDNEQFGGETTGSAAWGYALSDHTRLRASVGNAFKAPTFNDLYFPGFNNPLLRPERSRSTEIGLQGTLGAQRWAVNVFDMRVRDLIGFDSGFNVVNINTARIRGVEIEGATRLMGWQVQGNFALTDPENQAEGANYGKVLARRSERSARLSADHDFGPWRAGASLRADGRRFDNAANTVRLGGYAVADVRAEYRINSQWRAQVRIDNLFDREYETVYLYNQPRRAAYLTLRYQP